MYLVTPFAHFIICFRMPVERNKYLANSGLMLSGRCTKKQKLFRKMSSFKSVVTTEVIPDSSKFSEEDVKIKSPLRRLVWRSPTLIFTDLRSEKSTSILSKTFLYETNFALPSAKSALVLPFKPEIKSPRSDIRK